MKKVLAFVCAASMSLSLFALDIFNYVPVTGNVKTYTETNFTISSKFGNYFRTPNAKVVHTRDVAGREIEVIELTARDAIVSKTTNTYDVYGNLTEQSCNDEAGNLLWKSTTTYSGVKKADYSEYGKDDILKSKTIFTYDKATDLLIDETGYDGDGTLVWKIIYTYDDKGVLSVMDEYNADGSLAVKTTYTYSDDGKIDTLIVYDDYTQETLKKVFRYTNAALTEITTYNTNNVITKRLTVKYDNGGNVSKLSEYNIAQKFGTTVNELVSMSEFLYK